MIRFLLFILALSCLEARNGFADESCLTRHLSEARDLNRARRVLYERATEGRSREISERLLNFEALALIPSAILDLQALRFQRAGIPVICNDLIPLTQVPEFLPRTPVPSSEFQPLDTKQIDREIRDAYQAGGFPAVSAATERLVSDVKQTPSYHCLVRHFLDSILRASNFAPIYSSEAKAQAFDESPERISWEFIELQVFGLAEAERLDELAAPTQAAGVPILCEDVPAIPPL